MANNRLKVVIGYPQNGGSDDKTVKVSASDTTPAFLLQKLISTDGSVSIDLNNPSSDENVDLKVVGLGDKVNSVTSGEPTGSDRVANIVSLTQAEYDAGNPVATTFYLITDA